MGIYDNFYENTIFGKNLILYNFLGIKESRDVYVKT